MPYPDPMEAGRLLNGEKPATQWFYVRHGRQHGPISSVELRIAAHIGFLGPDDMVQRKGRNIWVLARAIPGLFEKTGSRAQAS